MTSRSWARLCALTLSTLLGGTLAATTATGPATAATAADDPHIKVVGYNVGDQSGANLRGDLRRLADLGPTVIAVQEVADRGALLDDWADNNGFRYFSDDAGRASKHNGLLVRNGVTVKAHGTVQISPAATVNPNTKGTHGTGEVPPKYVNWVRISHDRQLWVVGTVHLTTGAQKWASNRALHHTQVRNSAEWFRTRDAEPILLGDFNAGVGSPYLADLRDVARGWSEPSHPAANPTGRIDIAWTRKNRTGAVNALAGYHSDHRPVVMRVLDRR